MSTASALSRRRFLQGLAGAGGFVLGASLTGPRAGARLIAATAPPEDWQPDVFLHLAPDGAVRIVAHRSEMGTGIRTALPMVLADELEADWERVTIEQATGDAKYGSQNTDGSRSIRNFYRRMRVIGATARQMLEAAAADRWGVPAGECRAQLHEVVHEATERRIGFGKLVEAAAQQPVPAEEELRLKSPEERRYVGKSLPITDQDEILTGAAGFGADLRLPGMKYAVIARSPVLGGEIEDYDREAALAVPGVEQVIELPTVSAPFGFRPLGGVAVIARDTWSAIQGRRALNPAWDPGDHAEYDSDAFREQLLETVRRPGEVVRERGDAEAQLESGGTRVEAEYTLPHLAHAPMEPPAAVARVNGDSCEVWAPTQNPQAARQQVATSLGVPADNVTVRVTLLGGGFGRKSKPDSVAEAALLAREAGAPVLVQWTREDDVRHDYYHSVAALRFDAALGDDGRPVAWRQRTAFPTISSTFNPLARRGSDGELGMGFTDLPFDLPHLRAEVGEAEAHVRIGWLRSVANVYHAYGVSTFADECAHAAGQDPLEYLRALIGEPRMVDPTAEGAEYGNYGEPLERYPIDTGRLRAVLDLCAEQAGWGRELPAGHGLGIAVHRSFLTYVAVVAEVAVAEDGTLTIPRMDLACDCGLAVHPDRVRAQMEGSAVFGAGIALTGEITAEDGAVVQSNFHDYPVPRIHQAPREVHVHRIESEELPGGVGEPGVPPVPPALGNAVFAATGKRIRDLPFSKHDLGRG